MKTCARGNISKPSFGYKSISSFQFSFVTAFRAFFADVPCVAKKIQRNVHNYVVAHVSISWTFLRGDLPTIYQSIPTWIVWSQNSTETRRIRIILDSEKIEMCTLSSRQTDVYFFNFFLNDISSRRRSRQGPSADWKSSADGALAKLILFFLWTTTNHRIFTKNYYFNKNHCNPQLEIYGVEKLLCSKHVAETCKRISNTI